jgi:type I restriction enzyme S subunit
MNGIKHRSADEMKDSGIEWIGKIPKEWFHRKIKFNSYVKGRIGWRGFES